MHMTGEISMTNGEYALNVGNELGRCIVDAGDITATNTGKAGNYNYAAVQATSKDGITELNMKDLKCLGDTFVGLRLRCDYPDASSKLKVRAQDISMESKDGLYGGYGLDGYVSGDMNEIQVTVGKISALGYGVNFISSEPDPENPARLNIGDISDAQFNVLKAAGEMYADLGKINSPNQGLNLSNTVSGRIGKLGVTAASITGGKSSAVDITGKIDGSDPDKIIDLTVNGDMISTMSDAVMLHGDGAADILVKGTVSGAANGFNGTQGAYEHTRLTTWKISYGAEDENANMFNLSDGSGNNDAFKGNVSYIVKSVEGLTVTKEDGTQLDESHDLPVAKEGDKLYVSTASMDSCWKLVNGTGAAQEDLQQDDHGYYYIVKAGGGIDFHFADNHDYQFFEPFAWTGNTETGYTAAEASYVCSRNSEHVITAPATIAEEVTKATFTENGFTRYTATVEASDSPDGQLHREFKDAKAILKVDNIKLEKTSYTYTGKAIEPVVTIGDANRPIPSDSYAVTY